MTAVATPRPTAEPRVTLPRTQRAGGVAALVAAVTYVAGFATMAGYLAPRGFTEPLDDPARSLAFLVEHQSSMYLWYCVLYVVGGIALAVLVLGVHDRLGRARPTAARVAATLGIIWAGLVLASGLVALVGQRAAVELATGGSPDAVTTWLSVSVVQDALGGGVEVVGACWVLLVAGAALRPRAFSAGLSVLGLLVGLAGLATLVPATADAAASVFGLGFILWYLRAGYELLRR